MTYISALLTDSKKYVKVWSRNEKGERTLKRFDAPYFFYIPDEEGAYTDIYGTRLTRLDFDDSKSFFNTRKSYEGRRIPVFESDIRPEYKVLSEHFYGLPVGDLNITFLDIEVDYDKERGHSDPTNPYAPISSVALYHQHTDKTVLLVVPPKTRKGFMVEDLPEDITDSADVTICANEKELLDLLFDEIEDSDVISGWYSDFFDVPYIYERANKVLYKNAGNKLCFNGTPGPYYREVERYGNIDKKLCLHGRISLDYLDVYKNFEMAAKPSYTLANVAEDELPDLPKLEYTGSLYDLYRNDFEEFMRYNIRDTVILKGLEEKKGYIKTAITMSHMATSPVSDVLGTIKIAEMSILNHCHYVDGKQVPDTPDRERGKKYDGATVIEPKIGMHEMLGSVDLKSLYPGTMRSCNISPETIVGQFAEGSHAFKLIMEKSDTVITFMREVDGKTGPGPAYEWREALIKQNWVISAAGTVFHQKFDGMIPVILSTWFKERKEFKKKMWEAAADGDTAMKEYYDRMQYIKKIQLNSMYGATGNHYFKFFDVRLAESTTLSGREILYHMARTIALELSGSYDMEADSIIYGDTDSVYFKTYKDNVGDALDVANHVCDTINKSFPLFMKDAFNCDEAHSSITNAAQEIVADRGIFAAKKYYMLHLVADDGKLVDKMKYMGVPIKKTTLPKPVKDKLSSFIERLLKGEDWNIIGPEVVYFKDELTALTDIRVLGLPIGIRNLEKYTARFNANEPDLNLPGHVRASILWNKCIQSYNDKESPRIISGDKVAVFYLTQPIGKFKSIAIPKDIMELPRWFIDHFNPIIDRKAQLVRLVDKPMAIMVSAAGIKVPTKKKLKFEEGLFG